MSHETRYGWCFDTDHLATGDDEPDLQWGPRDLSPDLEADLEVQLGHEFRIYDDDGELYYTGRLVTDPPADDPWELEDNVLFAPLDDYGTPGAGATEIRYKRNGRWETL